MTNSASSPARYPLAIATPIVGQRSETFVSRHVREMLPQGAAAICMRKQTTATRDWEAKGPLLELEPFENKVLRGMARLLRKVPLSRFEESRFTAFLDKHGVEVVMCEYMDWSLPVAKMAKRAGRRVFVRAHGYDISQRLRDPKWVEAYQWYNEIDGVLPVAESVVRRLRSIGLTKVPMSAIPCGAVPYPEPIVREPGDTFRILFTGRLVPKKAPLKLIEAAAIAYKEYPGLRVEMIGGGPLLAEVEASVASRGLQDVVTVHGPKPNPFVLERLQSVDAFALHSMVDPVSGDEEGLPVAIIEAMGYSLPVVSTRHAGIPEAVIEQETGLLVDEGDAEGMAAAFVRLAREPDLRLRMGETGFARAHSVLSWDYERRRTLETLGLGALA